MRVAGIMSGTSLDGIDIAIIDVQREGKFTMRAKWSMPYTKSIRSAILAVSNADTHTAEISRLNFRLGEIYADAFRRCCKKTMVHRETIKLIGCHGQTVYHEGRRSTLQLGESAVIADRSGIDVVSNFRERDIAAGGQGAPLVPLADFMIFRDAKRGRIALNLGGIANITAIPANAALADVVAFDTGPANMVIDQLVAKLGSSRRKFDAGGAIARKGKLNEALLRQLLAAPYFKRKPPKSAGREQFGSQFADALVATGCPLADLIATATHLTAESVALAIRKLKGEFLDLVVAGGGAHNAFLMELLAKATGLRVATSAEYGIPPDYKEAVAFALLAWQTVNRKPGNVRSATGARRAVILGKITRA